MGALGWLRLTATTSSLCGPPQFQFFGTAAKWDAALFHVLSNCYVATRFVSEFFSDLSNTAFFAQIKTFQDCPTRHSARFILAAIWAVVVSNALFKHLQFMNSRTTNDMREFKKRIALFDVNVIDGFPSSLAIIGTV